MTIYHRWLGLEVTESRRNLCLPNSRRLKIHKKIWLLLLILFSLAIPLKSSLKS